MVDRGEWQIDYEYVYMSYVPRSQQWQLFCEKQPVVAAL